ncbi:hypothetical protein CRG98_001842 [Punica granatum]|uniref:Uncharacterized protein n=1 Tax=Punica granatum TaxID=22663 RepID=A0A2I0LAS7_PUNGR|nr:hypothetical protein CRG98_001842 [Punica granatum]
MFAKLHEVHVKASTFLTALNRHRIRRRLPYVLSSHPAIVCFFWRFQLRGSIQARRVALNGATNGKGDRLQLLFCGCGRSHLS